MAPVIGKNGMCLSVFRRKMQILRKRQQQRREAQIIRIQAIHCRKDPVHARKKEDRRLCSVHNQDSHLHIDRCVLCTVTN
jgi:hypothetical protein